MRVRGLLFISVFFSLPRDSCELRFARLFLSAFRAHRQGSSLKRFESTVRAGQVPQRESCEHGIDWNFGGLPRTLRTQTQLPVFSCTRLHERGEFALALSGTHGRPALHTVGFPPFGVRTERM